MSRTSRALKNSRVKVAVRCRPAFQDEIDFAKGEFASIVQTRTESTANPDLGQVSLTMITGKQRDFHFDYVFGEDATQDFVYDRLARPVVAEVVKGINGTIFAYGQTGTGKTYTMGILEFVNNEHAGLIPRAIQQIFEHVESQPKGAQIVVTQSFLQLYRETIQDLLAPASNNASSNNGGGGGGGGGSNISGIEESLIIREDPMRGFYVEGLTEYVVRNYRESGKRLPHVMHSPPARSRSPSLTLAPAVAPKTCTEALINLGLENRAIAPTLMNSTSSRSHTILTLRLEQRLPADPANPQSVTRTLRSKLLMVDLAGSERVRRTVSKGARLSEAKSINSSLSALGNVIAALADHSSHIPYRDSKLTRLLQDSLGGNAATSLIATIGPAAINYGETLSTLLFAQRCMAVKIAPVAQEIVDYAELCAKLQLQVSTLEGRMTQQLLEQQEKYEAQLRDLRDQLETEREHSTQLEQARALQPAVSTDLTAELDTVLQNLASCTSEGTADIWFNRTESWDLDSFLASHGEEMKGLQGFPDAQLVVALGYAHELIRHLLTCLDQILAANHERETQEKEALATRFDEEAQLEKFRLEERMAMYGNDPKYTSGAREEGEEGGEIGSHLAPLSKLEAMTRVEGQFRSNNAPLSRYDRRPIHPLGGHTDLRALLEPRLHDYASLSEFCSSLTQLHAVVERETQALQAILSRKDGHYEAVKQEMAEQMVERRRREEEVVNWSYILKYLLASASKLRKQLRQERRRGLPPLGGRGGMGGTLSTASQQSDDDTETAPPPLPLSSAASTSSQPSLSSLRPLPSLPGLAPSSSSSAPTVQEKPASRSTQSSQPMPRAPPQPQSSSSFVSSQPSFPPQSATPFGEMSAAGRLFTPVADYPRADASAKRRGEESERGGENDMDDIVEDNDEDEDDCDQLASHLSDDNDFVDPRQRRNTGASTLSSHTVSIPAATPAATRLFTPLPVPSASRQPVPSSASSATSTASSSQGSSSNSAFAAQVAYGVLGIKDDIQARQAMKIIDQVQRISPQQLQLLDEETRREILQIRKDLGLGPMSMSVPSMPNPNTPATVASSSSTATGRSSAEKSRSQSAPRPRATTASIRPSSAGSTASAASTHRSSASAQAHLAYGGQGGNGHANFHVNSGQSVHSYGSQDSAKQRSVRSTSPGLRGSTSLHVRVPQRPPVYHVESDEDDDNFSQLDFAEVRR